MLVSRLLVGLFGVLAAAGMLVGKVNAQECRRHSQASQANQEKVIPPQPSAAPGPEVLVPPASWPPRQDLEGVTIESCLVTMPPDVAESFMTLAGFQESDANDPRMSRMVAFLNDRQVRGWMAIFEVKRTCNILEFPRITVDSGQLAPIAMGEEMVVPTLTSNAEGGAAVAGQESVLLGGRGRFLPVVSADGRFVRLEIDWTQTWINESPTTKSLQHLTLNKTVVLPVNGSVVYRLGEFKPKPCESSGPPVLCKIPYLDRLFTNVASGSEEHVLFLMVTARVIANEPRTGVDKP